MQTTEKHFNIAIIVSRFNEDITKKLYDGAIEQLQEVGYDISKTTIVWVPGAIEIPITAQRLAKTGRYQAIICLGAVILGETKHFEYVCQQVSAGCQQVALTHDIPVIFGVLTTETEIQAQERTGGAKGHIGKAAVNTAIELLTTLEDLRVHYAII